jgi:hypothetical protein
MRDIRSERWEKNRVLEGLEGALIAALPSV